VEDWTSDDVEKVIKTMYGKRELPVPENINIGMMSFHLHQDGTNIYLYFAYIVR
jgi:hypothetical protein